MVAIEERREAVEEKIQETRKLIQLSEGQNKAFYEEAEAEKKRNREEIHELREAIRELHLRLHDATRGSEKAVEEVLETKSRPRTASGIRRSSARVSRCSEAIKLSEYRLHDHVKRLNFLQHKANEKEIRLAKLKQYLEDEGEKRAKEQQESIENLKMEHVTFENDLERILVQVTQSETVKKRYEGMITSLKGDEVSYRTSMEAMEKQLAQERDVLKNLRECRKSAERTRDDIRGILHQEETSAFECRREREKRLEEFRKRVEESTSESFKRLADRKMSLLRTPTQRLSPVPTANEANSIERVNREMDKYYDLFSKLKVILGVTNFEEVYDRLLAQKETKEHLYSLREATLQELNDVKMQKELLQQELHRVKYAITEDSAKLDGAFDELESKKHELKEKKEKIIEELEEDVKILAAARAAFESMAGNLMSTELVIPDFSGSESAYVLFLKDFCLKEVTKASVMEELPEVLEEGTMVTILGEEDKEGIPESRPDNVRVSFLENKGRKPAGPQVDDANDSGEEEEAMARRFIKRQAQMIVETKSRRRNRGVSSVKN